MKENNHRLHKNRILENCPDQSGMETGLSAGHQPLLLDSSRRELGDVLEINNM
jgi:hypothetical protein